jgi:hypothetical protein
MTASDVHCLLAWPPDLEPAFECQANEAVITDPSMQITANQIGGPIIQLATIIVPPADSLAGSNYLFASASHSTCECIPADGTILNVCGENSESGFADEPPVLHPARITSTASTTQTPGAPPAYISALNSSGLGPRQVAILMLKAASAHRRGEHSTDDFGWRPQEREALFPLSVRNLLGFLCRSGSGG